MAEGEDVAVTARFNMDIADGLVELVTLSRVVNDVRDSLMSSGTVTEKQVNKLTEALATTKNLSQTEVERLNTQGELLRMVDSTSQRAVSMVEIERILQSSAERRLQLVKEQLTTEESLTRTRREQADILERLRTGVTTGDIGSILSGFRGLEGDTRTGEGGGVLTAFTAGLSGLAGRAVGGAEAATGLPIGSMYGAFRRGQAGAQGAVDDVIGNPIQSGLFGKFGFSPGVMRAGAMGAVGIGVGTAAYQGWEQANQLAMQYGQLTGNESFSEAAGYELDARMTAALNPFIDTQQAREMMQTALREGYGGTDHFDNVVTLMETNMRNFGMSARESVQLYTTAIEQADMSLVELNRRMERMRDLADDGGQGLQALMETFTAALQTATGAGLGPESGMYAESVTAIFAGDRVLEGINYQGLLENTNFLPYLAHHAGTTPTDFYADLITGEVSGWELAQAQQGALTEIMSQMTGLQPGADITEEDVARAIDPRMLRDRLANDFGLNVSIDQAVRLAWRLLSGEGITSAAETAQRDLGLIQSLTSDELEDSLTLGGTGPIPPGTSEATAERTRLQRYYAEWLRNGGQTNVGLDTWMRMLGRNNLNPNDLQILDMNGEVVGMFEDVRESMSPDEFFGHLIRGDWQVVGVDGTSAEGLPNPESIYGPGGAAIQQYFEENPDASTLVPGQIFNVAGTEYLVDEQGRLSELTTGTGLAPGQVADYPLTPEEIILEQALDPNAEFPGGVVSDEQLTQEILDFYEEGGASGIGGGGTRPRSRDLGSITDRTTPTRVEVVLTPEAARVMRILSPTGDVDTVVRLQQSSRGD